MCVLEKGLVVSWCYRGAGGGTSDLGEPMVWDPWVILNGTRSTMAPGHFGELCSGPGSPTVSEGREMQWKTMKNKFVHQKLCDRLISKGCTRF